MFLAKLKKFASKSALFLPFFNDKFSTHSSHCCAFLQSTTSLFHRTMENQGESPSIVRLNHLATRSVLREQNAVAAAEPVRIKRPAKQMLIAIEGNIGSGKSTLLKQLTKSNMIDVMMEPVDDWCNVKGKNMLELLYSDPRRWGYAFNSNAMLARMKMHCDKSSRRPIRIMERSLYATRHVFVEQSYQAGNVAAIERAVLDELFHTLCQYCDVKLDRIVYLRATPQVCLERIQNRGRKEEASLSLDFLTSLHNLYDEWLLTSTKKADDIPVVVIDATRDIRDRFPEIFKMMFEPLAAET